jgi:peptidyl-prolyl cis-trans isomerase A (cyclophilin A)
MSRGDVRFCGSLDLYRSTAGVQCNVVVWHPFFSRLEMRRRIFIVFVAFIAAMATAQAAGQSQASQSGTTAKPAAPAKPTAIIHTTTGDMTCTLFPDKAPIGVANFIGLANGTRDWKNPVSGAKKHGVPLYDGTIFHRVIPEFMIQGGDPAGNGQGDPGYQFKNEVSSDLLFDRPGRLAYANSGPDTNGSQFFITEVATPQLNGRYTIFGQCDEKTVELVKQIARMATDPATDHKPLRPVKIIHITILHAGAAKPASPGVKKPATTSQPSATGSQ